MRDCEHLLIDGFNLIHSTPDWKGWLKKQPERARDALADWVRPVHDVDGVRTTLVFDGQGPDLSVERPFKDLTFSFVFSPSSMTADTVIEQLVGKAADARRVLVVSDDRGHQHTALALGAQVMGIKELEGWIDSCQRRLGSYLDQG